MTSTPDKLNLGQREAAEGFFSFLFSTDMELNIAGPGGVGKTFLMGQLIDEVMPRYFDTCKIMGIPTEYDKVVMTATTNQAAEVLGLSTGRPTETIHSFLKLRVRQDFKTGHEFLTATSSSAEKTRTIIFIDEASMICKQLRKYIKLYCSECKVVYVGDHCQLAPVGEKLSSVYLDNLPFFELTEPMRNNGQPALMKLCDQLRETVKTGVFKPIKIVPGVIDWLNNQEVQEEIISKFSTQTLDDRILAFTNSQVIGCNEFIRDLRSLPYEYQVGEQLISNSSVQLTKGGVRLSIQEEVEIKSVSPTTEMVNVAKGVDMEVRKVTLRTRIGSTLQCMLPVDRDYFAQLVQHFSSVKDWVTYFHLKETYPDLRQRDAATVHKAQGSTVETVFVDVGNLSTCHDANTVARLLYVAATRAKQRVILYGELSSKYGGLTY
jgi:nucleoside-triphosphatase THEP1